VSINLKAHFSVFSLHMAGSILHMFILKIEILRSIVVEGDILLDRKGFDSYGHFFCFGQVV
jgi:hypothetical protein